ncbi:PKD domain-containing protein [Jatrophihabitans telluris]|uniref:PKD domain-containing protein n=1 Tax=Jatrophihabitans telluris TaxID=2038343 RepID=UPI003D31F80B
MLDVWSPPGVDVAPTSAFSSSCTGLSCSFDGRASSDPDGTIASYSWDFGDGTSGSGATVSHSYAAAGTFSARLTVTDNQGATGSVTHSVTASAGGGGPSVLATDSFNRTSASGWGSADTGGAWTVAGTASNYTVGGGSAAMRIAVAGSQPSAYLGSVASTDTDLRVGVAVDKIADNNGLYLSVVPRRVSANNEYRARLRLLSTGAVSMYLSRVVAGAETVIGTTVTVSGLTATPNATVSVRVQAVGTSPTVLKAKAWLAGGSEPSTWTVTGSDTTAALQAPGGPELISYLSSTSTSAPVTARFSGLTAVRTAVANQPPTAAFTASCPTLTCSFDAGNSSDPDGTITSYAWTFGDGTTGSGASPTHTYQQAGPETVSLVVTDNAGSAATISHTAQPVAPPVNSPPTAAFVSSCSGLACSFDGTGSADSDGTIASYSWVFGDGSPAGSGSSPSYTYAVGGTFTVTLTVTDNQGATNAVSHDVTVTAPPPPNSPPTAAFVSSCSGLACSFDGTGSADSDGTISSYSWVFGDGSPAGSGSSPSYTYAVGGTFTVTLTVTDNQGATNAVSHDVTVTAPPPPNSPPTAAFVSSCSGLACSFDGTGSADSDGTIASYSWVFGDGSPAGSGSSPAHTYAAGGTFTVTLTVTDNQGATNTVSHDVTVTAPPPPNNPPTAAFVSACSGLACSFDGTGSADSDGTIASYSWVFGDGSPTGSGSSPAHTYAAGGTFTVTLTVTDNQGATNATSRSVTVTAPSSVYASDAFNRSVTNGFGTADQGGPWSLSAGSTYYSVAGGLASIRLNAGQQIGASLASAAASTTDADITLGLTSDKAQVGNGLYTWVSGRRVSATTEYRARIRLSGTGAVFLYLTKVVNGTETALTTERALTGTTFTPGALLRVRVQVFGTTPTTVRAKVWPGGTTEPTAWAASTTDTTSALQVAGGFGFTAYLSSAATNAPVLARIADLSARHTGL